MPNQKQVVDHRADHRAIVQMIVQADRVFELFNRELSSRQLFNQQLQQRLAVDQDQDTVHQG